MVNETTRTSKQFIALGCFFGLGSVLVGAFGAHALEQRITISDIETIRLGAQYQMYHAFALILTSTFNMKKPKKNLWLACWFFSIGTIIFCGSLYTIALSGISSFGMIAPIGGIILIGGWVSFGIGILRK